MKFSNYIQMQIIQYIPIHQYIQIHNIYYLQFFMGKRGLNLSYLRSFIFVAIFSFLRFRKNGLFHFQKTYPFSCGNFATFGCCTRKRAFIFVDRIRSSVFLENHFLIFIYLGSPFFWYLCWEAYLPHLLPFFISSVLHGKMWFEFVLFTSIFVAIFITGKSDLFLYYLFWKVFVSNFYIFSVRTYMVFFSRKKRVSPTIKPLD